jgi:hypothetical protein
MYSEALFSAAALYAACFILFGMLSLKNGPFEKRRETYQNLYGTPIPEPDNRNRFIRFSQHFFLRPSLLQSVVVGVMILRWYAQPLPTLVVCIGMSAVLMAGVPEYQTKFIPCATIAVGVLYGSLHVAGLMYGWHDPSALGALVAIGVAAPPMVTLSATTTAATAAAAVAAAAAAPPDAASAAKTASPADLAALLQSDE